MHNHARHLTLLLALAASGPAVAHEPGFGPRQGYFPGHRFFGEVYWSHLLNRGYAAQPLCHSGSWGPARVPAQTTIVQEHGLYASTRVPAAVAGSARGRQLVRDLDGRCFERFVDADGNELLDELPARQCAWQSVAGTRE